MSNIYFIRHGQAGTRDSYDSLSDLGRRQARLLGEYFVSQGIEFASVYAGALMRQQQTAVEVGGAYRDAGLPFPDLTLDAGWDEFDFHHIYREIAPLLSEDDADFRREYEAVCEQVRASAGAHDAEVHRSWRASDTKIVEAWVGGLYPYAGESWEQFVERVSACRLPAVATQPRQNVAVFTSATPTAIWTGRALDISDGRVRRLASVLENTSYTVLQMRGEELLLLTFNAVPHLHSAELRTRR
ncbi:MAG TPA: histidine phosphatase family protein [Pyrinomonadaceae bacterium]|nr:histidine phosphatase family protein [Pyrinomonadaceae bacterium]